MEDSLNQQQCEALLKQIKEQEKKRKTKETALTQPFIPNLRDELERELDLLGAHIMNSTGGIVLEVVTAPWQVDASMAGEIFAKRAVVVFLRILTVHCCLGIVALASKAFHIRM